MNLRLVRKTFTAESTIGVLSLDGKTQCFSRIHSGNTAADTEGPS